MTAPFNFTLSNTFNQSEGESVPDQLKIVKTDDLGEYYLADLPNLPIK